MQSKEAYLTTTTFRRSSDTPREESPSHPRHQNLHKKHHHHHHHHHRNSDKPVDYQLQSGSAEVTDEATAFEANGPTEVMKEESSLRPTGLFIPAMGDEDHGVTSTTRDSQGKTTVSTSSTANDIETSAPAADNNRQGKLLEWTDISMVVMGNKKKQERVILDHVSGQARPGETTAILGASGAGKTSLFHVLAGRIQHKSHLRIHGHVYLSHQIIDPSQRQVRLLFAYVAQHDTLHESSTPQEALAFSAKLRSGSTEKIDSLIHELGLESVANTKISSLSGGERRRTSIGVELVSNPSILLLDEPTSGLDSFAAKQVLGLLQKMARAGNTVIFTIHQPSSDVFSSFDRLILLHKGRMMHHGLTRDIPMDFKRMGYKVPENYNPADWILDVAQGQSMETLEAHGFFPKQEESDEESGTIRQFDRASISREMYHTSWCVELEMLLGREKNSLVRNPMPMIASVVITAFLAVIFGVIFFGVGKDNRADLLVVQAVLGSLVNVLIAIMMGQSQSALGIFSRERGLFLREYSTNHYTIVPYFAAKLASEALQAFAAMMAQAIISYFMIGYQMSFFIFFVILYALCMTSTAICVLLGSMFENPQISSALFPLAIVPQFYFSGVFISTNLIPDWISWAQWLCSMKYSAGLAFIYEFEDCGGDLATANCNRILSQNNVNPDDRWWYWLAMATIFVVFRLVALLVLRKKGADLS